MNGGTRERVSRVRGVCSPSQDQGESVFSPLFSKLTRSERPSDSFKALSKSHLRAAVTSVLLCPHTGLLPKSPEHTWNGGTCGICFCLHREETTPAARGPPFKILSSLVPPTCLPGSAPGLLLHTDSFEGPPWSFLF